MRSLHQTAPVAYHPWHWASAKLFLLPVTRIMYNVTRKDIANFLLDIHNALQLSWVSVTLALTSTKPPCKHGISFRHIRMSCVPGTQSFSCS